MKLLRILVVDDEIVLAKLIAKTLSREASDFSVVVVGGGQECLEHLKENKVDCILSDYQMPGMNGMELLKTLKAKGDDTPFIFITGQGNEEIAREAFKEGASDYFTKDAEFAHFARIINSIEQAVRHAQVEKERETTGEFLRIVNQNEGIKDLGQAATVFFREKSGCHEVSICLKDGYDYYSIDGDMQASTGNCNGEGYESVAVLPLRAGKERLGLLQLNDRRKGMFSPEVISFWERLADKLAVAIAKCLAEQSLREYAEKFHSLFVNSMDAIILGNPEEEYTTAVNKVACEMFGYSEDEFFGMKKENMFDTDVRYLAAFKQRNEAGMFRGELTYVRKDGTKGECELSTCLFSDKDGRPRSVLSLRDLAKWKELERQKEEFMAMITHDLKSPIATILGYCDLIVRTLDKKDLDLVDGIQAGAGKLRDLIDNFLTLTKLEAGKVLLNPEPTDISVLLEKAGKEFAVVAAKKGVDFQMEISRVDQVPLDGKYIERAVSNLVQNAVNYTDAGGRVLLRAGNGQGHISISVKDDGAGIPQDDLGKIFQKYYRSPKTSGIKGTGLGLAIVKLVVEAHNGRVEVKSEPGKGSEFTIFLPLK
jgi:PAS domain S-box-containing protein